MARQGKRVSRHAGPSRRKSTGGDAGRAFGNCEEVAIGGCRHCCGRIQRVNATDSLNISAGVLKPSVLRGLSFNCLAIALSWSCE